jgi:uncharacterized protein YcaQ
MTVPTHRQKYIPMPQRTAPKLISNTLARRIFMHRQGLCTPPTTKQSKDDLRQLIGKLGFVQLDSIATVERAHHMTLFARNQTYQTQHLAALLEDDKALFENWTHDASVIPTEFFPYWMRRFERDAEGLRSRWQKWQRIGFEEILDDTIAHITEHGPVMSRSFGGNEKKNSAGWWNWNPSKTALEYLWRTGRLAVTKRQAFQKVYDITERVIPSEHLKPIRTDKALVDWCCTNALERLGFAAPGELAAFWGIITAAEAQAWCADKGKSLPRVITDSADGSKPKECLADPAILSLTESELKPPPRLRVISPFDPVVRDRKRLRRLFNFEFRIEVFVPEAKREYGYYVFPLLEGDRFVGRIDMKRNTKTKTLNVTGLWWEPGIKPSKQRLAKLDAELIRIARFVECNDLHIHCATR